MKHLFLPVLLAGAAFATAACADTASDVVAPIHQFIDGFNHGDTAAGFAAYDTGTISIVDEFAPHQWIGPNAAHDWADEYGRHSAANQITDGIVTYAAATRTEVEGDVAYVIVPTVYTYREHGRPIAEEGQMTFVLHHRAAGWKIAGWTWSGPPPHPAG
jgi:hypothetical protein